MSDDDRPLDRPAQGPTHPARPRRLPVVGAVGAAALAAAGALFALTTGSSSSGAAATAPSTTRNSATEHRAESGRGAERRGIGGRVTAVDGKSLTVDGRPRHLPRHGPAHKSGTAGAGRAERGPASSYTVTTTGATKIMKLTDGSVSDLATGDTVVVVGKSSDGTVAAERIVQIEPEHHAAGRRGPHGPPEGMPSHARNGAHHGTANRARRAPNGRPVVGTVTGVDGSTVTIRTTAGDTTKVTTTSDTTVEVTRRIAVSSIHVDDTVRVVGTVTGSEVAATTIVVGDDGIRGPAGRPGRPGH